MEGVMINKVQDAMNEQINKELYSAYLYCRCRLTSPVPPAGLCPLDEVQGKEQEHAMKFTTSFTTGRR